MKHHYTKIGDGIYVANKEQNDYLFLFFVNKFMSFSISKMNTEKNFVENLPK
jgi:hypothetical protein